MELSRYTKDSLLGVISFIITASVLNLLLGVEWVPSVVLASVVGVAAGTIVDKVQGSLKIERDLGKMDAGLERLDIIESDIDEVKSEIGEIKTGIGKIDSKFDLIWSEFKKRKEH